jgi:4-hydroxybenzoate polyprenyltransferase
MPTAFSFVFLSLSFICSTSAIFVINQYFDKECDKLDYCKKKLPIASGAISGKVPFILFLVLSTISLLSAIIVNADTVPFFIAYLLGGLCYSAPPFRLKKRPIIDVIFVGLGAGVFPLLMGIQVSHQLTLDFSLFWIRQRYQDAFLTAVPVFLFQCGSHILHTVGDYDVDLKSKSTTFAIKYGKESSSKVGILLLLSSAIFPIFYGALNLVSKSDIFLKYYLGAFALCMPCMLYFFYLLRDSSRGVKMLRIISEKFGAIILFSICLLAFLLRMF